MFGRMMNNYYYGKSGKGDFRKEDLPETRSQLFRDTLRTRLSALCRLNLLYMLVWLPTMIVIMVSAMNMYSTLTNFALIQDNNYPAYVEMMQNSGVENVISEEEFGSLVSQKEELGIYMNSTLRASLTRLLLWLFPAQGAPPLHGSFSPARRYSGRSPGWLSRASQSLARVEILTAFAFPVLRMDML